MIGTQENLPPINNEPEVDYSIPKLLIVLLVGCVIAAGLGFSFAFGGILKISLWSAGLLVFLGLQSLFVKDLGRIALFLFLETAAMSGAVFYWNAAVPIKIFGIGVGVFYLLAFLASRGGRAESESSLKVNFFRIARSVISGSLAGLLVLEGILLSFAINPTSKEWISQKSFEDNFSRPLAALVKPFIPGLDVKMDLGDFLNVFAEQNAAKIAIGGVNFNDLPAASQKQYLQTVTAELKKTAEGLAGVKLDSNASVSDNLYNAIKGKLSRFIQAMPSWFFTGGVVAFLFVTVESFAWFFNWVISVVAWLIYEMLVFFGFARIGLENRSRETVILR
ncbi:MAG: hypothetical protein M1586_00345 [Patescibacteria group bacterium]|nr:hypothetical protein [Patescibacteria group bacterium]MCL5261737.1 hypothetical protein [Patescibacteria group bacterium]